MNRRSLFKTTVMGIAGLLGAKDGLNRLIEAKTEPTTPSCVVDPPVWTTSAWTSSGVFTATMPPFTMTPDPMSDHYWITYVDGRIERLSYWDLYGNTIPWSY